MINHLKHQLWCEKYRPTTLDEYIFHDKSHKSSFTQMVNDKTIPHLLLSGVQGSGKAQPLYSKILTPSGWRTMGDLTPGDVVCTPSGQVSTITETFPQGKKDIYTITFHDGASTECCLDHLWECYFIDNYNNRTAKKHIVDTKTLIAYIDKQSHRSSGKFNISIPLIAPVQYSDKVREFDIPPYLLGVLLGDGSLCSPTPKLTSMDDDIIMECQNRLMDGYKIKKISNTSIEYHITNENRKIYGGVNGTSENYYTGYFRKIGLYGKRSHEKFIPREYISGTLSQRWELVQGLMDTDGTISKKGSSVSYTTTSHQLAATFQEILWSLGCTCTLTSRTPKYRYKGKQMEGKLAFTLHMNHNNGTAQFFKLNRKKERGTNTFAENHNKGDIVLRRRIKSIEYKATEEAQCILIDDPSHLYITDDYIVTHNTTIAQILIDALDFESADILIINASDENSVDNMREKIKGFISTFAMGEFKIVLLEEADHLSVPAQAILRKYMEDEISLARFILTCNYAHRIIPALKSRMQHYRFTAGNKNKITEFCAKILIAEEIQFDLETLDKYVATGYPDIRKIVNLLQQHSISGKLINEAVDVEGDYKFQLLDLIAADKWNDARILTCGNVSPEEWESVYRFLYENLDKSTKFSNKENWEVGIVTIAEHLYKHLSSADPEINAAAMFISLSQV